MVDPEDTRILVSRALDGDRDAFDGLVERFRSRLRSRLESWSQFHLGPGLDTEEVLQDTFVRAFQSLGRFEWRDPAPEESAARSGTACKREEAKGAEEADDDAFFRWLRGIARHAVADAVRRARRETLARGVDRSVSGLPEKGPTQSRVARRDERFDRLEAALEKLPADYRRVLVLARLEGLTTKEIAARMERSRNAVKHLMARALRELKKNFGDTESFHLPDRQLEAGGDEDGE